MGIVFKNNAKTTLASSLSNSATSATVTDGGVFPTLGAGEFFLITFDDGTNNEICKCTARSSNTLTIVRAQDNTSARAFSSGDAAEGRVTAGVLETIQENIAAKSADQTVYNATTASSATAYDIGIDPGVEANAMVFLDGVMQHHDTFSFSGSTLTFDAAPTDGTKLEVIVDNLINLQSSNLTVDSFTAADVGGSAQTAFTLSDTPAAETNLIVFVEGVFQDQDAYTISSSTLTITTGVIAGRGVTVYVINPVNIGTPSDGTITSAKLSGNLTLPGTLTVGANDVAFDSPTFVVDNSNSRVGLGTANPTVPVDIVGETKMSSHLNLADNAIAKFGAGSDLQIYHDGSQSYIVEGGTGRLNIESNSSIQFQTGGGELLAKFNNNNSIDLYYDNAVKLATASGGVTVTGTLTATTLAGTLSTAAQTNITSLGTLTALTVDNIVINDNTISNAAATMIFDSAGEIRLSADDNGEVHFYDGSLHYGSILEENSNLIIQSIVQDEDILFKGNDGSTVITALTLDMSKAGEATFNSTVNIQSATPIFRGTDSDDVDKYGQIEFNNGDIVISADANSGGGYHGASKITLCVDSGGEKMRITNDGKVGIGTTSPDYRLVVRGAAATNDNIFKIEDSAGTKMASMEQDSSGNGRWIVCDTSGNADVLIHTAGTSHFNGGNVGIGTTSAGDRLQVLNDLANHAAVNITSTSASSTEFGISVSLTNSPNDGTRYFLACSDSSTTRAIIRSNGNLQNANNSYGQISDSKLKENIVDATDKLSDIVKVKVRNFNFIGSDLKQIGVVAQELETIFPSMVEETIDTDSDNNELETTTKSVKYSIFVPILVKAIQEQQTIIEDLKARIETLEG